MLQRQSRLSPVEFAKLPSRSVTARLALVETGDMVFYKLKDRSDRSHGVHFFTTTGFVPGQIVKIIKTHARGKSGSRSRS